MTRNAYIQACAVLVVITLSLSGLSMADGGSDATASVLQERTMSVNGVAVDADDNIIVTGEVYDDNAEKWTIRTEKYDGEDGHLIWRKEFKEYDQNIGKDIAVDGNGNVIVAGATGSAGDLLPNMDYFLIKYSKNGDRMWDSPQTYNNGMSDVPWRVTVDKQTGNIFVTGVTIRLIGGDTATTDIWTIKCSGSNGDKMEEHVLDIEENADMGIGIALTSERNVVVAGSTKFDAPYYDAYCLQRYTINLDTKGNPFFYRGENTNESASGLAIDSSDNIFVTGHSSGRSGQDFLTVKYDKNDQQTGKDLRDIDEVKNSAQDIAVDHADNVIITGSTEGKYFCTIKYDNNLENRQWIQQESFVGEAKAVAVDSQNNVIVAGYNTQRDNQYYTIKYNGTNGDSIWEGGGGAAPSEPPEASFTGPGSAYAGQPVQFTDTSTGDVTSRSWDFGDGGTGTGASPTHTYSGDGTYTVTLTVSGPAGQDTATKQITITNAPPKPSFEYTPLVPVVDETVSFDGSSTYDPYGGNIVSYAWDFGDGNSGNGETTSHTYTENGTFQVTLTVTDDDGDSATASKMVTVNTVGSNAPTALFDYEPTHPDVGQDVTLDGSASTDDGTILLYRWDWDNDGTYDEELAAPTAAHRWSEAGTYTVTLAVEDNNGTINTYSASITVGGGEPALLLSTPSSIELSNGRATAILTVSCLNQTVDNVYIEVDEDAGASISITPAEATIQAGAQQNFSLDIELPGNATGDVIRVRAVGADGVESPSVDVQLTRGGNGGTPGFAALLAIAAIFIVLLVMRRLR